MTPIYLGIERNKNEVTAHVLIEQTQSVLALTKEAETTAFCDCLNRFTSVSEALEAHAGEYNSKFVKKVNGRYVFTGGCGLEDIIGVLNACGYRLIIKQ